MKKIRIDRKKWLRGVGPYSSKLWDKEQQLGCCLGHFIHQTSKCSWNELQDIKAPNKCFKKPSKNNILTRLDLHNIVRNTELSSQAMRINDNVYISNANRESQLINLFKEKGFELEFFN